MLTPGMLTAVLTPMRSDLGLPLTVLVALLGGIAPAVIAGALSSLLIHWFFTPPVGTLTISDPHNAVALVLFVLVGAAVSLVVHLASRRAADVLVAHQESMALAALSHTMLSSADQLALLFTRALETCDQDDAVMPLRDDGGRGVALVVIASSEGYNDVAARALPKEHTSIERIDDEHDLVLVARSWCGRHSGARQQGSHGVALGRLARPTHAAGRHQGGRQQPAQHRGGVLREGRGRTARGRRDVGRPPRRAHRQPARQCRDCRRALATPEQVTLHLEDDARRGLADAGLLDRVLGNVLENACRYGGGEPVIVTSSALSRRVELRVADRDPGVPQGARGDLPHVPARW